MKRYGFISALGFFTGVLFMVLGIALVIGAPLLAGSFNSMLHDSSLGLRAASGAIRNVTEGVGNSASMVEEVRLSLLSTSEVITGTGEIVRQTVTILEQMRIILPLISGDMHSMPVMVRSLIPDNHFEEVAERTQTVASELGFLNARLESLAGDIELAGNGISSVALSVEILEDDLLSAEGSFGDAASKMEDTADTIDKGSFGKTVILVLVGTGLLVFLMGLYQISAGILIRRLEKERAST